jgi:hypothetical protein
MIKRAHRLLVGVIVTSLLAGCCCVYTSTGTLLMDATASAPEAAPIVGR